MEKKKNILSKEKNGKHQYRSLLDACEKIDKSGQPSVNNLIIYNLNNINIPQWKDLSKIQKVAIFFRYIVDENWVAVTLRFSNEFMKKCAQHSKLTDFIRRRLNENFKNRLGYVPEYMFCIEFKNDGFHIHGAIKPEGNLNIIQKVLKTTAFGRNYTSNPMPENCKLRCKPIYDSYGWGCYILKRCYYPEFDIYMGASIIKVIRKKYLNLLNKQQRVKLKMKKVNLERRK